MLSKCKIDLGDYSIVKELNSGSYGRVFLVKDNTTEKPYAAKVIDSERTTKMLVNREIGIFLRMKHPTIVKFFGYSLTDFEEEENVTLILQYAAKGSLEKLISNAQKKIPQISFDNTILQKILIGVARGMMYLHEHRVIHRDLKPANILLDDNYEPHISDFGTSKFLINDAYLQTEYVGTLIYMAPEVFDEGDYNGKADVFSFGILMYEVLTRSKPYSEILRKGFSCSQFRKKIKKEHYRPKFETKVKTSLQNLIEECWSDDPKDRPTFEEIFNKLAYGTNESVYNVFEKNDDNDEESYYLDGIDIDEVLSYVDKINVISTNEDRDDIVQMKEKIARLENMNEKMNKEIKEQMSKLRSPSRSKIASSGSSPIIRRGNSIEFNYDENYGFNGILNYIKKKSKDYSTEIEIVPSSFPRDSDPKNIILFNEKSEHFKSKDEKNSWIYIKFLKSSVIPKMYTIRSIDAGENSAHPKSWVIEGSIDGIDWDILDKQIDCNYLNGKCLVHTFPIEDIEKNYECLRFRLTDTNWYNNNKLCINCIEFYGILLSHSLQL